MYLMGLTSSGLISSKRDSSRDEFLNTLGSGSFGLWGKTANGLRKMLMLPRADVGDGSGVGVPDELMVALSKRRISLLLDHQAGQLVQPSQATTAIMMSTVLSVSNELMLASVAVRKAMALVSWTHMEARGRGSCVNLDCGPLAGTCET